MKNHRRYSKTKKVLASLLGFGLLLFIYMFFIEPNRFVITRYVVQEQRWQQPPLKIAILSDIHAGSPFMTIDRLNWIVDRVNEEEPDLVLLCGDYVSGGTIGGSFIDFDVIVESLSKLKSKVGTYAVLGNHDWWESGERAFKAFQVHKIPLLENTAYEINQDGIHLWITGIADDTTRKQNFTQAYREIPSGQPIIQISHDPISFQDTPDRTLLSFAAHTHGGQVNLPLIPNVRVSRAPRRWSYGYIEENNKKMIVTSGLGTSILPLRFNRPPEVVIVSLQGIS